METPKHRFAVLDSFRGLCACLVVLHHLHTNGWISNLAMIRNGWLFVDFFFVLSGFVIAASYGDRLRRGFSLKDYMFLRLGRVYPLHVFVIGLYVLLELVGLFLTGTGSDRQPFSGSRNLPGLFYNLSLIQIFGLQPMLTWNSPSWSIAAEVWAYLLAAVTFRWLPRPYLVAAIAALAAVLVLALLGEPYLERTFSWSLVRCIYGFGLGTVGWHLYRMTANLEFGTLWETAILVACVVFASLANGIWTLLGPPLFLAAVLIFANESGRVSKLVSAKPFLLIGTLSYSIYMVHLLVLGRAVDVLGKAAGFAHIEAVQVAVQNGLVTKRIVLPAPLADIVTLGILGGVIVVAFLTYKFVELPCREWSRRQVKKKGVERAEAIAPTI